MVNFDVIKDMILNKRPDEVVTDTLTGKLSGREKTEECRILSEAEDKIYRVSFFKRRRLYDNNSVPFGYFFPTYPEV